MKKLVWVAGLILAISFVAPYLPLGGKPVVDPVEEQAEAAVDTKIVSLLRNATKEDKARIRGVYTALKHKLIKDAGKRVVTTEQWRDLHGNTLDLAIPVPGKYEGLDIAIDNVFLTSVGTDDVLPGNEDTRNKLVAACEIVTNSAR